MEEREQGIRDIQEEIGQTNEIFKDLAVLVYEQGVVIGKLLNTHKNASQFSFLFSCAFICLSDYFFIATDDIQSNIEASSGASTQARVQLSKASKSSKSKCTWVCNFILALLSFIYDIEFMPNCPPVGQVCLHFARCYAASLELLLIN